MPDAGRLWELEGFLDRLDAWNKLESPPDSLRRLVTTWIMSRSENPYQGVRREPAFPNLWFGAVPRSEHGPGMIVACSYWIYETQHVVRCDSFASLSLPV
jgi:hypothetical protein